VHSGGDQHLRHEAFALSKHLAHTAHGRDQTLVQQELGGKAFLPTLPNFGRRHLDLTIDDGLTDFIKYRQ